MRIIEMWIANSSPVRVKAPNACTNTAGDDSFTTNSNPNPNINVNTGCDDSCSCSD